MWPQSLVEQVICGFVTYLTDFALHVATNLQATVSEVIGTLPETLKDIPAVKLYPYASFAQTKRVAALLLQ